MSSLPDFREEKKLWRKGFNVVIGVDEVGRGAFAGPLVAAAVAWQRNQNFKFQISNFKLKIDDSKRLSPSHRRWAAKWIKENCLVYGIGEVGVQTINKLGIGKATAMAMRRALRQAQGKLQKSKTFVLVDAFHVKYVRGIGLKNQKAIKKGDQKSVSIAAASIIAKVYRDTLMRKLTKRYKKYQWGVNKGYGTKKHQQAILQNGPTLLHRKQFVETFLEHYLSI